MTTVFKIVIIDDDTDDHYIIKDSVEREYPGSEVLSFYDAESALKYLLEREWNNTSPFQKPHLVLIDINMPRKNGFSTLLELKESYFNGTLFIILSTSTEKHDIAKAYEVGADGIFTKPNTFAEFRTLMRQILSKVGSKG